MKPNSPPSKIPKPSRKSIIFYLIGFVFILLLFGFIHFASLYSRSQSEISRLKSEAASTYNDQEDVNNLIAKVGQLMELPEGENPTVATITDKQKLSDQPFFDRAENGDRLLIYTQAKKAVLYRPSTNKIIEVSPVNIGLNSPAPSVSPTPQP